MPQPTVTSSSRWASLTLLAFAFVLALPVLALAASWLGWNEQSQDVLVQMLQTVLPGYVMTSVVLCVAVAASVGVVGTATACMVTLFEFPGRRTCEWLLLLPLAMPAYVVAYAYTDFLQFSGPLQTLLRDTLGLQGRVFPEVRNLGGAVWVFTFTLYPYVYLLVRTALGERAAHLIEAARVLGASLPRRIREVALPMARPAVAAGMALALMETLADYGVASYFGVQSFTAGIYKAWLVMDNRSAAAELATLLLATVGVLMWLERHAQRQMRYASTKGLRPGSNDALAYHLRGPAKWVAWAVCGLPVLAGFVLPVLFMLRPLIGGWETLAWHSFWQWAGNSVMLAGLSGLLATAAAFWLAFAQRRQPGPLIHGAVQLVGLGYAVPGAVLVVGLLLPVGWIQGAFPQASVGYWMTATILGLVWAYLVRFTAVALQSVQSGYARIPVSLDDSARMLGASGPRLMARVHWPLLRGSMAAAGLLVFVDVMKELPATLVLRPFNSDTLAVVAYQLARDERLGEAALPALSLVLVGLIPVILLSKTMRRD